MSKTKKIYRQESPLEDCEYQALKTLVEVAEGVLEDQEKEFLRFLENLDEDATVH